MFPEKLHKKLQTRSEKNALRSLASSSDLIDFASNDYLGFARTKAISQRTTAILAENNIEGSGATGSRLLSGNHKLYSLAEKAIVDFHQSEAALIFNSGYDANIGFFQSVPQRTDVILYDAYIHASVRDGISLSHAKAYKFSHNDLEDLNLLLEKHGQVPDQNIYVITESVFSMDGDCPDLKAMTAVCHKHAALLVVDEAHALGVLGNIGQGSVQDRGLEDQIFARIVTFGKALGAHGAAILGSEMLRNYLINFARSFIYTTALSPHAVATIMAGYERLSDTGSLLKLQENIGYFKEQLEVFGLQRLFISSSSAIHCAIVPGNTRVKMLSRKLKEEGYDVKPILSPTVPNGEERLRFCLHSFNTRKEIKSVLSLLARLLQNETHS